jgi:hypothetical protein
MLSCAPTPLFCIAGDRYCFNASRRRKSANCGLPREKEPSSAKSVTSILARTRSDETAMRFGKFSTRPPPYYRSGQRQACDILLSVERSTRLAEQRLLIRSTGPDKRIEGSVYKRVYGLDP